MSECHPAPVLGVIGGSGLYEIDGLTNVRWEKISGPWGEPSDELLFGELDGIQLVFLPRHGRGHRHSPSTINYRANIDALKRAGVTDLISLSAVGSFREELPPGTFVIVDQFIDRTFARGKSFFGAGMVAHVSMAHPVNPRLGDWCARACENGDIPMQRGGTYLVMEGPQFSTLAESQLYRQWNCDVIGMTNMPEANWPGKRKSPMPPWPWSPISTAGIRITMRYRWRILFGHLPIEWSGENFGLLQCRRLRRRCLWEVV